MLQNSRRKSNLSGYALNLSIYKGEDGEGVGVGTVLFVISHILLDLPVNV